MSENTPAIRPQAPQVFNFFDPVQFETMQRVSKMFAHSELVPDIYKVSTDNPEQKAMANCMIAIEVAQRIGASPLMVMQNLVIIYGRPSWSSKFLIATVNTCGRFNSLQFKFEVLGELKDYKYKEYETVWEKQPNGTNKKSTKVVDKVILGTTVNLQCIAYTTARDSNQTLEGSPVSIEMAINEGWYTKKGSKWPTMTKQMLMYRAASFWTSAYAPELSMGMKTEDEIRDIEDIPYEDVTPKAKANSKPLDIDEKPVAEKPVEEKKEEKTKQEEPQKSDLPPDPNF